MRKTIRILVTVLTALYVGFVAQNMMINQGDVIGSVAGVVGFIIVTTGVFMGVIWFMLWLFDELE